MDEDLPKFQENMVDRKNNPLNRHTVIKIMSYVIGGFLLGLLLLAVQFYLPIGFELLIILLLCIASKTSVFVTRQKWVQ